MATVLAYQTYMTENPVLPCKDTVASSSNDLSNLSSTTVYGDISDMHDT